MALGEHYNKIFARDEDMLEHKLECEKVLGLRVSVV